MPYLSEERYTKRIRFIYILNKKVANDRNGNAAPFGAGSEAFEATNDSYKLGKAMCFSNAGSWFINSVIRYDS